MNEAKGERGLAHALYHNRNLLGLVTPACHNVAGHRSKVEALATEFSRRWTNGMNGTATHSPIARPQSLPRRGNQCLSYSNLFEDRERVVAPQGVGDPSVYRPTHSPRVALPEHVPRRADGKKREWTKGTRGRSLMMKSTLSIVFPRNRFNEIKIFENYSTFFVVAKEGPSLGRYWAFFNDTFRKETGVISL